MNSHSFSLVKISKHRRLWMNSTSTDTNRHYFIDLYGLVMFVEWNGRKVMFTIEWSRMNAFEWTRKMVFPYGGDKMWLMTSTIFRGRFIYRRLYLIEIFDRRNMILNIWKKIYYGKIWNLNHSFTAKNFLQLEKWYFEGKFNWLLKKFIWKIDRCHEN